MKLIRPAVATSICAFLVGWTTLGPARAEQAADLPEMARSAKAHFAPLGPAHVQKAGIALDEAIGRLDGFLARGGPQYAGRWKAFLGWSDMTAHLSGSSAADLQALETVLAKYYTGKDGMELEPLASVRHALRKYIDTASLAANPNAQRQFEANLDALADALGRYAEQPSGELAREIGLRVDWLERAGQAADLVAAIRRRYSRANLLAHLSREIVAAGIEREVDDESPIEDVILGTDIYGTGVTKGRVSVELVPNDERAVVLVRLQGVTTSNNVGYNGPATIRSTGTTRLDARKRLSVGADGVAADPATAQCETDMTIQSVYARSCLVRRLARKRTVKKQGLARQIASEHAEARVARRLDKESAPMLKETNEGFSQKFLKPLGARDATPQVLDFRSTAEAIFVEALQAGGRQLAAPTPAPALSEPFDMSVRVHESLVNNAAETMLAGVTLTDEKLAKLAKDLTGSVPEGLRITPEKDPWSITFARQRPVTVVFADGGYKVSIRGSRFTRGDQVIKRSIEISAAYKMEKAPDGAKLTRQGEVGIVYLRYKGRRLSVSQIAFKTFLTRRFSEMFPPELTTHGLLLPGRWKQAGRLSLRRMQSDRGWLTLGWDLPSAR